MGTSAISAVINGVVMLNPGLATAKLAIYAGLHFSGAMMDWDTRQDLKSIRFDSKKKRKKERTKRPRNLPGSAFVFVFFPRERKVRRWGSRKR